MKEFIKNQIKKRKNFVIYAWIGLFISILSIFLLWVFIDVLRVPTVIGSTIVIVGLFLFKFYLYKKTGFTQ